MNPKNFPERKNRRRKVALKNLNDRIGDKTPTKQQEKELNSLEEKIKPDMRGRRTKKFRNRT